MDAAAIPAVEASRARARVLGFMFELRNWQACASLTGESCSGKYPLALIRRIMPPQECFEPIEPFGFAFGFVEPVAFIGED